VWGGGAEGSIIFVTYLDYASREGEKGGQIKGGKFGTTEKFKR